MKPVVLILLLIPIVSCKTVTTKPITIQVQKPFVYDYRYETGASFLVPNKLHYYKDINTIFIKLAKSKGKGC